MAKRNSEYNDKREIKHRLDRLDRGTRDKQISKSKMFKDINIAQSKLHNRLEMLKTRKKKTEEEIQIAEDQVRELAEQRAALGFEHEIVVTEHAMLRYVERFRGVDMDEVYDEIIKLPKKDVTKYGNTVVTVYPVEGEKLTPEDVAEDIEL
jgi:hypothetical protein